MIPIFNYIEIQCPHCGATMDVDEERKECFCSYCGNKILIDDGMRTFTHIHIDKTKERELDFEKELLILASGKKLIPSLLICIAVLVIGITSLIIHNNSNVFLSFGMLIIGCSFGVAPILKFEPLYGSIAISIITIIACIIFVLLSDNEDALLTFVFIFIIVFNCIGRAIKKYN